MTTENPLELHARIPLIDGHADTIGRFLDDPEAFFREPPPGEPAQGHLDGPRLRRVRQNVQVMAVYTPPEQRDLAALQYALDFIDGFRRILAAPANAALDPPFRHLLTRDDLRRAGVPGRYGFLLFLEGASPLRGSLRNLRTFFELGVRGITLTHNHDNEAAMGCFAEGEGRGLTPFGRELIGEMERLGMAVDLAHSNESVFWEALALATRPVIDSHTGLRRFWDHPRNLSDAQVRALADRGGVVCIDFVPDHLKALDRSAGRPPGPATLEDVVRSIAHAVEVAGTDHVGLGSDWDGFAETVSGLEDAAKLPDLTAALLREGFTEEQVAAVLGGNLLRVLGEVLPARRSLAVVGQRE